MQRDLLTMDELRLALTHIPADDRDTWVNIGNAVKTEYGDDGFFAWDEWSQGGDSYNAKDAQSVWKSLQPGHVRLGTIIKLAGQHGWKRERKEMTAADRKRMKAEQEERRRKAAESVEADKAKLARMQQAVSRACQLVMERHLTTEGSAPYLTDKGVGAHGVMFVKRAVLVSIDAKVEAASVWVGSEVKDFFDQLPKPRPEHLHLFRLREGDTILPLYDGGGVLWSLQVINSKGTKLFPKFGRKSGCWHRIAWQEQPAVIGVSEGYATGASVHEAMEWPMAVALDAGNLARVVPQLRDLYPQAELVICGDDDVDTEGNPGRTKAEVLAFEYGCRAVFAELGEVA
ncbi:PriCT-2 domain-containing protein [Vreelandella glaciei]|uniref:PriCT-2 domain-containing protein n=1 Tax=Vreelandella glaciei TaxID=186761 RepID=UPI0030EBF620